MAFVDEIVIHAKAGRGGDGVVRFRHEKGKEFSGPSGGNGGKGGDVYVRATRDIGLLSKYRHVKEFQAERGEDGMKDSMFGRGGEDLIIDLPLGSCIKNLANGLEFELLHDEQVLKVLKGGNGGIGNEQFKGSTNQRPQESTPGKEGEEADFHIELRLMVDAGLIGLPNAGKSSLINVLTNAKAKVAGYQFTTLEPNLGDMYGYIIADIPGLIEGASEGKGLGYEFLRHVSRTKKLFHCISLENEDPLAVYTTIRTELAGYSKELAAKDEVIILTKTDVTDTSHIEEVKKQFSGKRVLTVSVYDDNSIKLLRDTLVEILRVG